MSEKTVTTQTAGKPATDKLHGRIVVTVAGPVNYERRDYKAGDKIMALPQDVEALKAVKPAPKA